MATSTFSHSPAHPTELQRDAPTATSPSESSGLNAHVNGYAAQQNAVDALPPSLLPNGEKQTYDAAPIQSISEDAMDVEISANEAVAPITNVASGIKPVTPYIEDTQESIPQSHVAAAGPTSSNGLPGTGETHSEDKMVTEVLGDNETGLAQGVNLSSASGVPSLAQPDVLPLATPSPAPPTTISIAPDSDANAEMVEAVPVVVKIAREREEDDDDVEPSAKRAKTETPGDTSQMMDEVPSSPPTSSIEHKTDPAASHTLFVKTQAPPSEAPAMDSANSAAGLPKLPVENGGTMAAGAALIDYGPMSDTQTRLLLEGMRNIKKSKSATAFVKPVDPVILNLPHYFDVIKNPMDLGTMEQKLKSGQYNSVQHYVADFDQMVQNSVTFNGPDHVVTQSGTNIRSILNAQLKRLPRAGEVPQAETSKKSRKRSVSGSSEIKPRAPRPSIGVRPAVAAPEPTYALDHDGMPQIRRHPSIADGRPKREIHKPPPKDLPYSAKPKKKKFQLELRFCQETLDEITRPAYANTIAAPFLAPVDPVALNIPNYRSIVKKPMDFGTVRDKLQAGLYENAKDFDADVRLIFSNCTKFNGKDHPITKMAMDLEKAYDEQWAKKNDWLGKHAPPSAPQSPEADEEEETEEEEEEDDEEIARQVQLEAIHGQFAQLSAQLLALQSQPIKKAKSTSAQGGKKGTKASKGGQTHARRKSSSGPGIANLPIRAEKKTKSKPIKKVKAVTNAQKEEISEKIGLLSSEQMARAADIIKNSLRKAGRIDLADRAEDEMEYEIDQIPDEALHELLKLVRKTAPAPTTGKAEDTDYRPVPTSKSATAAGQGKSRKNKPMKGVEQDMQINRIKAQLDSFQGRAAGLDDSADDDVKNEAVSSGDESESGSESEEE